MKENEIDRIATEIIALLKRGKTPDAWDNYPNLKNYINDDPGASRLIDALSTSQAYAQPMGSKAVEVDLLVRKLKLRKRNRYRKIVAFTAVASFVGLIIILHGINRLKPSIDFNAIVAQSQCPVLIKENGDTVELQSGNSEVTLADYKVMNRSQTEATELTNKIIVPARNMVQVTLPDGSQVTLNAGSRLLYPSQFSKTSRRVELSGEAFFDITKHSIPFEVVLDQSLVRVYGTRFNVNSSSDSSVQVVLLSGRVGFIAHGTETTLKPGEQCSYDPVSERVQVLPFDDREALCWINNEFNYTNIRLTELLSKFSAWYGVNFEYDPHLIESYEIYISVSRDTPFSEVLSTVENATNIQFEITDKDIILLKRKLPMR